MGDDVIPFFKCLADDTRFAIVLLIQAEDELCVCELTHVLSASQPKISRHLAQLRACEIVADRRQGQWVYYRLHAALPGWARGVLANASKGYGTRLDTMQASLARMGNRPDRQRTCC